MEQNALDQHFAKHLTEDGKRSKTIQSYVGDVSGFLVYLQQKGIDFVGDIKRFHITSYRNHLIENGYEASTINKKINSLQAFNHWLVQQGLSPEGDSGGGDSETS